MAFFIPFVVGVVLMFLNKQYLIGGLTVSIITGYLLVFFLVWEPRMLCRHCPYYAEGETSTLHCYANAGLPLVMDFCPSPATRWEQIQFVIGLGLFIAIPVCMLLWAGQIITAIITFLGALVWLPILRYKICPDCLNFSCPFNRVPKEVRDAFLRKNPVIREAWEAAGCNLEDREPANEKSKQSNVSGEKRK